MKVSRKLDVLIRFFRETVGNPNISHRTRMSAAIRLDDIYARHLLMEEKAAARKERAEARAAAQQTPGGVNATQETMSEESELTETDRLSAVFDNLLRRKVSTDDTDTD